VFEEYRKMKRSRLETYVSILAVLSHKGPLKPTHIMYKANVNHVVLMECLAFLVRHGLVEEKAVGKKLPLYTVTQYGVTVVRYFGELRRALPVVADVRTSVVL
jgi:predicted transcriptional regulator